VTAQTKLLAFSLSGFVVLFVGMFGPSLGIQDPLQTILLLFALILIGIGVWFSRQLKKENQKAATPLRTFTQKQKIWIFVLVVSMSGVIEATASFWLPLTTSYPYQPFILWVVPLISFPILAALFAYMIFKKLP